MSDHMKARFENDRAALLQALLRQEIVCHRDDVANAIADAGEVVGFATDETLVEQGGWDNDVYFIVSGAVAILVHQAEIRVRKAGVTVGEVAAIEPSLSRSATVRAVEPTVAVKLTSQAFQKIVAAYPQIGMAVAQDLARRLYQRNETIAKPNQAPRLFIVSSTEALEVAYTIRDCLPPQIFSTVWDQGVFFAGGYPLEGLETLINACDFAVAIAEADDIIESRGKRAPTLRDNVLFELGLFMGRLTRHRALLVHPEIADLKLPSDLYGLTLVPYTRSAEPLAARLEPVCKKIAAVVAHRGVRIFGKT